MRPFGSPSGISWCRMPLPAVIHCTSPAPSAPRVAEAVPVLDGPREHVGDGLDAAMGMPGEARPVVVRPIVAEVVEQQERIELCRIAEAECPAQLHARSLHGWLRLDDAASRAVWTWGLSLTV